MLNRDELLAVAQSARKVIQEGTDRHMVAKALRLLAPAFGYSRHLISRALDESDDGDLLAAASRDMAEGHMIPPGLIIGGHKGLKFSDILAIKLQKKSWWKKFMGHMAIYDEVVWVLLMRGSGFWVIHNTVVDSNKRRPSVIIPAQVTGLNHIQVIRLELFVEEKSDE